MRISARFLRTTCAALVAIAISACGGGGGGGGPNEDPPTASATIGVAGGTVASSDGRVVLTIPAGALGNPTEIRITELAAGQQPAAVRATDPLRVYRLEPSGTSFATPARLRVELPASATGAIAVMGLHSNGSFEAPANMVLSMDATKRVLSADVPHFSEALVRDIPSVHAALVTDRISTTVGSQITATFTLTKEAAPDTYDFEPDPGFLTRESPHDYGQPATELSLVAGSDLPPTIVFGANELKTVTESRTVSCVSAGSGYVVHGSLFRDFVIHGLGFNPFVPALDVVLATEVQCTLPQAAGAVAVGLFNIPGLTAPDGINYFAGPVANLPTPGPFIAVAGAEGVKVIDAVTRQVALDRTATGPDGATLGTSLLGATPVAQAASAGAPAALVGFSSTGAAVQNWNATNHWGASIVDAEPTFDAVTAGGGVVSNTVALVRPVRGIDFVGFDGTANAYRIDPARFAPYAAFPGIGNLVSAQIVDAASGDVLVLGRAAGPSISTSTKVFYKAPGDAQATTLLSMGNVDARRLRCIPVGMKQACVATLFGSGQGRAFLFDPATPRATPAVIVLTAAAGTLGVAQALRPNGHVAVAMANFTANSLTVAELSADLATIHSLGDIAAPTGCTGTAHVALLTDSEGLKAVTTCNGTDNYWVVKLP
jgi:hypothetical protein